MAAETSWHRYCTKLRHCHRKFGSDTETIQHKHKYKQNTTIKSITSSFFAKLNDLLHLITKLAKAIHCRNVSYYKLILFFEITARQINSEVPLAIFHYINTPSFKKFHTKAVTSHLTIQQQQVT